MGSANLKANEPSMEEILASIRRIIADDQDTLQPSEPEEPSSSPLKNVLDLAELHVAPLLNAKSTAPLSGSWDRQEDRFTRAALLDGFMDDAELQGPAERPAPPMASEPMPKPAPQQKASEFPASENLLSNEASASVSESFDHLSASLRPTQPQTVEDLMKEMLRPMLKAWLDDNLPSLVERLVRAEIERVTRCRG
jgi:cell pole-organizing protein PopZ